jgi:hypothetical protein
MATHVTPEHDGVYDRAYARLLLEKIEKAQMQKKSAISKLYEKMIGWFTKKPEPYVVVSIDEIEKAWREATLLVKQEIAAEDELNRTTKAQLSAMGK